MYYIDIHFDILSDIISYIYIYIWHMISLTFYPTAYLAYD